MVRLNGICDGGGETTCLAHYRLAGYCGTGMKPPDMPFGAFACAPCHDEIDRRTRVLERDFVRLAHAEGCLRTIATLRQEGKI
jgi:hypothetical protein